jgi:hypothetical protein
VLRRRASPGPSATTATAQVLAHHARRQSQLVAVREPVQGDGVPGADDLGRQARVARDLLADEEEGRGRSGPRECVQRRRGPLRMGAVVEGQGDAGAARATRDPQGRGERRDVAGQRGQRPGGGGSRGEREG